LSTKYAFLKDGVGWGGMPLHMVEKDVAEGRLAILDVDDMPRSGFMLGISACHPASEPPGPAGRWFIDHLKASWRDQASLVARTGSS
jgi:DNA-binding transcriptional LysR family regulator